MSGGFRVPSSPPSTPGKPSHDYFPSSAGSFTPAGPVPSHSSVFGSSINMPPANESTSQPPPRGLFTASAGASNPPTELFTGLGGGAAAAKPTTTTSGLFTGTGGGAKPSSGTTTSGLFTGTGTSGGATTFGSGTTGLFANNNNTNTNTSNTFQSKGDFGLSFGSEFDKTPEVKGLFSGGGGAGRGGGFAGGLRGGSAPQKNLFSHQPSPKNAAPKPLGRSIAGSTHTRQPSRLSRSVVAEDFLDEEKEQQVPEVVPEVVPEQELPQAKRMKVFTVPFDSEDDDDGMDEDAEGDMWLDMNQNQQAQQNQSTRNIGDESDLLLFQTPAAVERVRREAEDIFRATARGEGELKRRSEWRYAANAKDVYTQMGTAEITESPQVILNTEALVNKLYDEGVGEEEDEEKMDDTLAAVAGRVAKLWKDYVNLLPRPHEEHVAEIGPGPHATPFEKANYLANLALQIHHTRYEETGGLRTEPLPETLFRWLQEYHDMYGNQVEEILRYRPSPACHSLFWQAVFLSLIRGQVAEAAKLLSNAGWAHVRRGDQLVYTGKALENVQRAAHETVATLETCPGFEGNWEIWSSDWTLFRVRAQGSLEYLRRFAEGKDLNGFNDSNFSASVASTRSRQSLTGMARRAESQVPWEIYENLNIVFDIVLGQQDAILGASQDWLEATIGLFGWWDENKPRQDKNQGAFRMSQSLSRSTALVLHSQNGGHHQGTDQEAYLDRLSRVFHTAVDAVHFNSQNPVELGMACVFEDNIKAVIGLLRGWSLPIASAVAEIASLGKWLPPHKPSGIFGLEDLDMDDLAVLGMDPGAPDEIDGIKDSTLVQYAQALSEYDELSTVRGQSGVVRDGWELAIHVFGRMDSAQRSEEMMKDLVQHLIDNLHVDSNNTVDKLWALLNELGMIPYAEDTAESFGEILARDSHRYGEAMWYYALAHRPNKVREVMNLLMSYSLIQSTAFPPANELDDYLYRLLNDRNKTLEEFAVRDMEGAELLGKMLSGYASLRQFYDIRDNEANLLPNATPHSRRQQAATALISVIASSDDNIRGGLFDQTRDGIVSEDFLLALLGEALVFVTNPDNTNIHHGQFSEPVITLDQIDTILKAIEDLQAVGSKVYTACEEFLQVVLASAPGGLKGSTPADLLKKSTAGGASMLAGSTLVASQLQKSLSGGAGGGLGKLSGGMKRGWDWRTEAATHKTKGEDVMRRLRLGLAKDLAGLWLIEADSMVW
ncbi:hypothetical protein QBC35DRAFT_292859 [Podospora australis]|uniref:Nuclear pore complex protein Nup85 n=1 Tax=Podospora australis TaxID=1536484 RepID=A0AAN7ALJ0_9PEZI|nr:hypothetical protein QBC35DRAFT_292859 [Podospora australis]